MDELERKAKLDDVISAICKGVRTSIKLGEDMSDLEYILKTRIHPYLKVIDWWEDGNQKFYALLEEALTMFSIDPEKYIDPDTLVMPEDTIN